MHSIRFEQRRAGGGHFNVSGGHFSAGGGHFDAKKGIGALF